MGAIAAIMGLLFVLASAVGAHALTDLPAQQLGWFDSATRILGFHALALLLLALQRRSRLASPLLLNWVGVALILGVLLFCGSLYSIALGAPRLLAQLAPIGGVLLMLGWLTWAWAWQRLR